MALLDALFGTPEKQQAMGLLAAGMMRGDMAGGLLGANQVFADAPRRKMQEQLAQMQLRRGLLEMDSLERENALQQQMREAAKSSYITPEQASARSMGPTLDGGPVPQVAPGFDMKGYMDRMFQLDPLKGVALQQAMAKDNKPITVAPGASLVDPITMKPVFTAPKEQSLPSAIQEYQFAVGQGYKGTFDQWDRERKKAGANSVSLSVSNTADKSYFGNVAEGLAKNDVSAIEAARSAPERVQTARRVKEILTGNPITGTGAEARLAINKAFATAGLVDGKNVADTEVLASTLAAQALDAIKSSGLGGGNGFSNADRDFLERARAGKIDMTGQTLERIADLNEKAAVQAIKRGNAVIGKLRMSPQAGQMGQMLDPIQEPSPPSIVRRTPPKPAAPGRSIEELLDKYGR